MPAPGTTLGETVWDLPPLILHPFNERIPPSTLLDNSKAALMLSGLIPSDGSDPDELHRRVLAGRYAEVRMLFFLGKDVLRWLDQCMDWASRVPELGDAQIRPQSFANLLTHGTPEDVKEKLVRWGVTDYVSIFSRAIGLNTLFTAPPAFELLAEEFLRNYHRYADFLYRCYMESEPHRIVERRNFHFGLYASGEYSRLLESQWDAEE
ncbi:MAG TPA: hypothetical protein VLY04_23390 [Bryobacteraceae bacterium]|nr:hypothetical protein [Bryobacteraceae bacterium]